MCMYCTQLRTRALHVPKTAAIHGNPAARNLFTEWWTWHSWAAIPALSGTSGWKCLDPKRWTRTQKIEWVNHLHFGDWWWWWWSTDSKRFWRGETPSPPSSPRRHEAELVSRVFPFQRDWSYDSKKRRRKWPELRKVWKTLDRSFFIFFWMLKVLWKLTGLKQMKIRHMTTWFVPNWKPMRQLHWDNYGSGLQVTCHISCNT